VNRFNYNMNIQLFVEYRSAGSALQTNTASKHVNTIKIQSIAASIRQHGLGVLNTTVNYTYQFLTQKFHIFREFLHDDYIRAHLSREHRWYRKHRHDAEVNNIYPYDHAVKFLKDIKKLGLSDGGKSYLDLFRMTITEIGNALGYVRMVRSASMYYCSEAVKYLPELENIISFEQHAGSGSIGSPDNPDEKMVSGANFHEECVRAGHNLDEVIKNLIKNFDAGRVLR
jgi:WASH complex subunit 7